VAKHRPIKTRPKKGPTAGRKRKKRKATTVNGGTDMRFTVLDDTAFVKSIRV
jgi:hypothetical protein